MSTESKQDGRPRKKKKKKEKSGPGMALWLGIGGGVFLVVLIVVGVVIARPWTWGNEKKEVVQNNPPRMQAPPQPQQVPDGNVVREPKSLLGNIRNRVNMTARDNEMRQIMLFYMQYAELAKNPASRTVDGFLDSFKRDSNLIYAKIKTENVYTVNVRARVDSQDILAFESEPYTDGYFCIRVNNQLGFVSPQDMKTAGLVAP